MSTWLYEPTHRNQVTSCFPWRFPIALPFSTVMNNQLMVKKGNLAAEEGNEMSGQKKKSNLPSEFYEECGALNKKQNKNIFIYSILFRLLYHIPQSQSVSPQIYLGTFHEWKFGLKRLPDINSVMQPIPGALTGFPDDRVVTPWRRGHFLLSTLCRNKAQ